MTRSGCTSCALRRIASASGWSHCASCSTATPVLGLQIEMRVSASCVAARSTSSKRCNLTSASTANSSLVERLVVACMEQHELGAELLRDGPSPGSSSAACAPDFRLQLLDVHHNQDAVELDLVSSACRSAGQLDRRLRDVGGFSSNQTVLIAVISSIGSGTPLWAQHVVCRWTCNSRATRSDVLAPFLLHSLCSCSGNRCPRHELIDRTHSRPARKAREGVGRTVS